MSKGSRLNRPPPWWDHIPDGPDADAEESVGQWCRAEIRAARTALAEAGYTANTWRTLLASAADTPIAWLASRLDMLESLHAAIELGDAEAAAMFAFDLAATTAEVAFRPAVRAYQKQRSDAQRAGRAKALQPGLVALADHLRGLEAGPGEINGVGVVVVDFRIPALRKLFKAAGPIRVATGQTIVYNPKDDTLTGGGGKPVKMDSFGRRYFRATKLSRRRRP
jgi:hypothetical protein